MSKNANVSSQGKQKLMPQALPSEYRFAKSYRFPSGNKSEVNQVVLRGKKKEKDLG